MGVDRHVGLPCGEHTAYIDVLCSSVSLSTCACVCYILHLLLAQGVCYFAHFAHDNGGWCHLPNYVRNCISELRQVRFDLSVVSALFPIDVDEHDVGSYGRVL